MKKYIKPESCVYNMVAESVIAASMPLNESDPITGDGDFLSDGKEMWEDMSEADSESDNYWEE